MKKSHIAAAALAALGSLFATQALADGHYVPGVEGMQAASVPPPGMYYLGYLVNYQIDDFRAPGSSSNLPGHNRGTVTALAVLMAALVALAWGDYPLSVPQVVQALLSDQGFATRVVTQWRLPRVIAAYGASA